MKSQEVSSLNENQKKDHRIMKKIIHERLDSKRNDNTIRSINETNKDSLFSESGIELNNCIIMENLNFDTTSKKNFKYRNSNDNSIVKNNDNDNSNQIIKNAATTKNSGSNNSIQKSILTISSSQPIIKKKDEIFYFLGRRSVFGYTLCSGYILRNQIVSLELGGKNNLSEKKEILSNNENDMKKKKLNVFNNLQKNAIKNKDRFSAGKLMFRTVIDNKDVQDGNNKLLKNISGRLSNFLCDFFLPLINANLIVLKGHIAYDIGAVGTFVDVPISLHILVSKKFLMLTENSIHNKINKKTSNKIFQHVLSNDNKSNNNERIQFLENKRIEAEKEKEIMDHANDLLLW